MKKTPSTKVSGSFQAQEEELSFFEKGCKFAGKILKIKAPAWIEERFSKPILLADLKVTPSEVLSFTILSFLISSVIFSLIAILDFPKSLIALIFPFFIAYVVFDYPIFYSEVIKVRAGNETVSIILHMVTYLSLTPVFEKAIEFAANNCHGPLGKDFKKVIWDVRVGKFPTMKEALSVYSKKWVLWNVDFVNSLLMLQMIELQKTEKQRKEILDRALETIMDSTAKKMEIYADNLKTPSLLLLLLGILLPLMGIAAFPIISIFLANVFDPNYVAIGYTVILPFIMWYILYRIISKRPATFSTSEKIEEVKPRKYITIGKINIPIIPIAIMLGFLVALPGIIYFIELFSYRNYIYSNFPDADQKWREYSLSRYEPPYILYDVSKAMFIVWGIGIAIIFAAYFRSKGPYEYDQFIKNLEEEFTPGLFELHTALRQDIPIESAVMKVIEAYKRMKREDSPLFKFFEELFRRLVKATTSLREILFGKDGMVNKLPSSLVKNVMNIVANALLKGPIITSEVAGRIASYLKRLQDMEHSIKRKMSDILSNLRLQGEFIGPFMSAIVGSAAVIIIQLLQAIARVLESIEKMYNFGTNVGGSMSKTLGLVDFKSVMPPTIMEVIAGIYLIEIVLISAYFVTGIHRGFNKVYRDRLIYEMMIKALLLYSLVFFISVLAFQPIIEKVGRV